MTVHRLICEVAIIITANFIKSTAYCFIYMYVIIYMYNFILIVLLGGIIQIIVFADSILWQLSIINIQQYNKI